MANLALKIWSFPEKYISVTVDVGNVFTLDSDFGMAYQGRALVYRKQGKIEEAKTNYLLAAQKYISSEEYDSARDSINDALSLDENYGEAYFYLGEIEFFQDNYLESLNQYDTAIDLGFVDYLVYANRGYTKFQLKRYEEAIADFDKAIEMDKTFATAYKWRGETYLSLPEDTAANKYENALKDFTKYLELEKDIDEEIKSEYEQKIEMCKTELKNSNIDITRVTFSGSASGLSGTDLKNRLFKESQISLEMADAANVVAVVTYANDEKDIDKTE